MHAFALGGLEGHRQAWEPALAVEEKSSGGEEFIGGLSKASLLVKGELAEEGDGVRAHTAAVLDGEFEGVVVGREEDLGLKHGGVVLSFLALGCTNGRAGGSRETWARWARVGVVAMTVTSQ